VATVQPAVHYMCRGRGGGGTILADTVTLTPSPFRRK